MNLYTVESEILYGVDVILDDGTGPWWECPWCEGTGYVDAHKRDLWLRVQRKAPA